MDNEKDLSAIFDFLADTIIDSNLPEDMKISVRICREVSNNCDKLKRIADMFVTPTDKRTDHLLFPLRKEVYEYLQLVGVGLDQFISTHPILGGT